MIYGKLLSSARSSISEAVCGVDPAASCTCDSLLSYAPYIDPQNLESLQLASVFLLQVKPDVQYLAPTHSRSTVSCTPLAQRITGSEDTYRAGRAALALPILYFITVTFDKITAEVVLIIS